jgi:hypothetical protein
VVTKRTVVKASRTTQPAYADALNSAVEDAGGD